MRAFDTIGAGQIEIPPTPWDPTIYTDALMPKSDRIAISLKALISDRDASGTLRFWGYFCERGPLAFCIHGSPEVPHYTSTKQAILTTTGFHSALRRRPNNSTATVRVVSPYIVLPRFLLNGRAPAGSNLMMLL